MTASEPALVSIPFHTDNRGTFSKPLHTGVAEAEDFAIVELYWTRSDRGAIRGLHFQTPPHAVNKLVWVSSGSVVDVVVDLRRGDSYGAVATFELSAVAGSAVWVPDGFAHGFQALTDNAIVNYAVDAGYAPSNDAGVLWSSIDFAWPLPAGAISERDRGFVGLAEFDSPFTIR